MKKTYRHLTQESRELIFLLLADKVPLFLIAKELGVNKSTVSREIKRSGVDLRHPRRYLPSDAQEKADERKRKSRKLAYTTKIPGLGDKIMTALTQGWTPQLIAGRLDVIEGISFCCESVYSYIYSREGVSKRLGWLLPRARLTRCRKMGRKPITSPIPNRIDIALRPSIVDGRKEFGHWEGDTMFFRARQPLATLIERKSRFAIVARPEDMTGVARAKVIGSIFNELPNGVAKSFTFDNGPEFSRHEDITFELGASVFFTKAYAAWQKGSVENFNRNVRVFLSRKADLNEIENWKLQGLIDLINNRPKKCLGFLTPAEVFSSELEKLAHSCTSN